MSMTHAPLRVPETWKEALAALSDESREQIGYVLFDSPIRQTATMLDKRIQSTGKTNEEVAEAFRDVEREDLIPLRWRSCPPPSVGGPRPPGVSHLLSPRPAGSSTVAPEPLAPQPAPQPHIAPKVPLTTAFSGLGLSRKTYERPPDNWEDAFDRVNAEETQNLSRLLGIFPTHDVGNLLWRDVRLAKIDNATIAQAFRTLQCSAYIPEQFSKPSGSLLNRDRLPIDWEDAFDRLKGRNVTTVESLLLNTQQETIGPLVYRRVRCALISDETVARAFARAHCKGLIPMEYQHFVQ